MSTDENINNIMSELKSVRLKIDEIRQLVGPVGIPMPDGSMLTKTIHGQIYYIDPNDTIIAPQMIMYRQWEPDMSKLMYRLCNEDTIFVDVGANFGYFTCLASGIIGNKSKGAVHAIEPNPHLCSLLRKNIQINWSSAPTTIYEMAATDFEGEIEFYIPLEHGANASLTPQADTNVRSLTVSALTLDKCLKDTPKISLMKIDVGGHEISALRGAQGLIERSPGIEIILEWSPGQIKDAGFSGNEIKEFMDNLGFDIYNISIEDDVYNNQVDWNWVHNSQYANLLFSRYRQ